MSRENESRIYLSVDQVPRGPLQVCIEQGTGGFRLAGPSYAGNSERLLKIELDDRAIDEIERMIGKYLVARLKEATQMNLVDTDIEMDRATKEYERGYTDGMAQADADFKAVMDGA